ncbi:MAG: hypothetical protein IIW04_02215, partial [Aeriscardovia sp.]|nr:hypothetical protein [Aeriscardovia sp.]
DVSGPDDASFAGSVRKQDLQQLGIQGGICAPNPVQAERKGKKSFFRIINPGVLHASLRFLCILKGNFSFPNPFLELSAINSETIPLLENL